LRSALYAQVTLRKSTFDAQVHVDAKSENAIHGIVKKLQMQFFQNLR